MYVVYLYCPFVLKGIDITSLSTGVFVAEMNVKKEDPFVVSLLDILLCFPSLQQMEGLALGGTISPVFRWILWVLLQEPSKLGKRKSREFMGTANHKSHYKQGAYALSLLKRFRDSGKPS